MTTVDLTHAQVGWWVVYRSRGIGPTCQAIREVRPHMGDVLLEDGKPIGIDGWCGRGTVLAVYPTGQAARARVADERRADRDRDQLAAMARRDAIEARALRAAIARRLPDLPLSELRLVAACAEAEPCPRTALDIDAADVALRLLADGASPIDIGRAVGEAEQPSLVGTRLIRGLRRRGWPVERVERGLWRLDPTRRAPTDGHTVRHLGGSR